jgi:perosamine synthetase
VRYVGADVVLADVDPVTYTIDPESVRRLIGPRTRAIIAVHLFGHPADMDALERLAEEHGLWLIEDATEALGSRYHGRACGLLGDVGCFSFNGNKVITAGGGGMLLARDPSRLGRLRSLTRQAREPGTPEYLHSEVGFNYVLSNLHGAVGLAQVERLDELVEARRAIARRYAAELRDVPGLTFAHEAKWAESNFWLSSVLVDAEVYGEDRIALAERCERAGIEVRPFFQPLHQIVPYAHARRADLSVSEYLHKRGVSLPSSASLCPEDQERVLAVLRGD